MLPVTPSCLPAPRLSWIIRDLCRPDHLHPPETSVAGSLWGSLSAEPQDRQGCRVRAGRPGREEGGRGGRCGAESESAARVLRETLGVGRMGSCTDWSGRPGGRVWSGEAVAILGSGGAGAGGGSRQLQGMHVSGAAFRGAVPRLCVQKLQAGPPWWTRVCPRHGWRLRALPVFSRTSSRPTQNQSAVCREEKFSCKPREPINPLSSLVSAGQGSGRWRQGGVT